MISWLRYVIYASKTCYMTKVMYDKTHEIFDNFLKNLAGL